jgi:predicted dehydrogenase
MITRREFLRHTTAVGIGMTVVPTIVSSSVFGSDAPSNRINIGVIGIGRVAREQDMQGVWRHDNVRIIAAADVDEHRLSEAKMFVENYYTRKIGKPYSDFITYDNYTDLIANKDIDAVLISTPDHWHARQTIDAVRAGKDVYLQSPTSLTIAEGRSMSNAVNASGRILQIGNRQRSMEQFRLACELVRNGRIGQLQSIEIRLPVDAFGGNKAEMPVPKWLNYDAWLGSTPYVYYTVDRVHPQHGYSRPGWLRCEQFGAGMITEMGFHYFDIAHWAMNREYSGPIEISGKAEFPKSGAGLWDVHGRYETRMVYDNGVTVTSFTDSPEKPEGILFRGNEGWIFVRRGAYSAASNGSADAKSKTLQASDPKILSPLIGNDAVRLYRSPDHYGNWLECIRTRRMNITPAEVAHRSCSVCLLQHIAMKLNRTLSWDPVMERFKNDDEANSMLARPQRPPYNI